MESNTVTGNDKTILYFDGVCNLCNRLVQWVLLTDKKEKVFFAPLQNNPQLLANGKELKTVILYHEGKYYYKSAAIFKALQPYRWQVEAAVIGLSPP